MFRLSGSREALRPHTPAHCAAARYKEVSHKKSVTCMRCDFFENPYDAVLLRSGHAILIKKFRSNAVERVRSNE